MPDNETRTGLGRTELYCLSLGQVIGAGIVTLVGPAIALTGYSAWLGYLLAIILGFLTVLPVIFITSAVRLEGGYYSIIAGTSGQTLAGIFAATQFTRLINNSLLATSFGMYIHSLLPGVSVQAAAIAGFTFFFVVNLCGISLVARVQKVMTWLLIAALLLFIVVGSLQLRNPVFDFRDPDFAPNGWSGVRSACFLFVYSTTGYVFTMNYGGAARNAKRDIPWALIATVPSLMVLYCGVAIVGAGVLPLETVANQPLTYAAEAILPAPLFLVFMIGGPIMALSTTMNSGMPANCIPIVKACDDGWFPKSLCARNRFGVSWKIYAISYLVGLLPLALNFSVKTITNNILLVNSLQAMMYLYAYYRFPKRYPEAWRNSRFHIPDKAYYVVVTVALGAQIAILLDSVAELTLQIVLVSLGAMAVCAAYALLRSRTGKVTATYNIWED